MAIDYREQPFNKRHDNIGHSEEEKKHSLVSKYLDVEIDSINGIDPYNNET